MATIPNDPKAIGFIQRKVIEMAEELGPELARVGHLVEATTDRRLFDGRGVRPNIRITLTVETTEDKQ